MDYNLTEEQEMLRKMARDFLTNECPKKYVREMAVDHKGFSPDLWKKMVNLGWTGLAFPAEYDGSDGSFMDLAILLEEMGRACLPGPFFSTVVLGGLTILNSGSEAQKKAFLPRISRGEIFMTLALAEKGGRYDAAGVEMKAAAAGSDFVLNGSKYFVTDANVADYVIVAARTGQGAKPEEGLSLFIVDAKGPGVKVTPFKTMAGDKQARMDFTNVKVPKDNVLGAVGKGWKEIEKALQFASAAKCLDMVGGALQAVEMTVAYSKERVQFNRPIGSFQVLQHFMSDMTIFAEGSRFASYDLAWRLGKGLDCAREAAVTKAWVGDACQFIMAKAHEIHGAIAFCEDHDLPLYSKRAKMAELVLGSGDYQRELVAQALGW